MFPFLFKSNQKYKHWSFKVIFPPPYTALVILHEIWTVSTIKAYWEKFVELFEDTFYIPCPFSTEFSLDDTFSFFWKCLVIFSLTPHLSGCVFILNEVNIFWIVNSIFSVTYFSEFIPQCISNSLLILLSLILLLETWKGSWIVTVQ